MGPEVIHVGVIERVDGDEFVLSTVDGEVSLILGGQTAI